MCASMGPQLKGCGRISKERKRLRSEELQWGRSLRAAEGRFFLAMGNL